MKLAGARENYEYFSGKLSEINRQLCFAGIAVVWIFATKSSEGGYALPEQLVFPLKYFVASLVVDLFQYAYASAAWGYFHRKKEKSGIGEDTEFGAPMYINWPTIAFFWLKVTLAFIGYLGLGKNVLA